MPPAIPGIMFLSGGQTEEEATVNLNAINVAVGFPHPFFSVSLYFCTFLAQEPDRNLLHMLPFTVPPCDAGKDGGGYVKDARKHMNFLGCDLPAGAHPGPRPLVAVLLLRPCAAT